MFVATGCTSASADTAPSASIAATSEAAPTPTPTPEPPKPVDLTGTWMQTNSKSADSGQKAVITGDMIEVTWEMPEQSALYWVGSIEVPQDGSTAFQWTSAGNVERMSTALFASGQETKDFAYDNGVISYEVTVQGVTATVTLQKQ